MAVLTQADFTTVDVNDGTVIQVHSIDISTDAVIIVDHQDSYLTVEGRFYIIHLQNDNVPCSALRDDYFN